MRGSPADASRNLGIIAYIPKQSGHKRQSLLIYGFGYLATSELAHVDNQVLAFFR